MLVRLAVVAGCLLLTACSGTTDPTALDRSAAPTAAPSVTATPARTVPAAPVATASPTPRPTPTAAPTQAPAPRRTSSPSPSPTRAVALCPRVPDVGAARQVVLVDSSGSSAVVRACERKDGRWVSVLGRMAGHVGYAGVAPPGAKREGDRRTPSGTYRLGRGFGVKADPGGTWFSWRRVTRADVWVDDPGSDLYNTWQQLPANGRWDSAESLYQPVDYAYAQVVDYNTARVPGRGSAIFLHVDDGNPTLGCITVPRTELLALFRWERSGAVIVIR